MNLHTAKEREEYYRYTRPYSYKQPPTLNPELAQWLQRSEWSDRYRFLWAGVCGVRTHEFENATNPQILGSREAFGPGVIRYAGRDYPIFEPKYLFARSTKVVGWSYLEEDEDGRPRPITVKTPDFIPVGRLVSEIREFYDLGVLMWQLEYRNPDAERDRLGKNDASDEDGWSWLMTMQTKNGLYYEPGIEMSAVIEKREEQNRNADLKKVAAETMQRNAKAQLEREQHEDAELKDLSALITNEALAHASKLTVYPKGM